ncbi:MAG TPA: DsbA family oxidoreductase [Burkholderiaceae bacterium]
MKIDFVSDVSCPWCAIGLSSLEIALARVGDAVQATLHFQPFELNPDMGPEGEDVVEHLAKKYGMPESQVRASGEMIRQRGEAVGFTFDMQARSRIHNTFDAHRLLHWAGEQGAAQQRALKKALFKAYFTDGQDPSSHEVLARCAGSAGLDGAAARELLAGKTHARDVRAAEAWYRERGIHSVPAIIIDDRHLISGGQPPEVFEQALRQLSTQLA